MSQQIIVSEELARVRANSADLHRVPEKRGSREKQLVFAQAVGTLPIRQLTGPILYLRNDGTTTVKFDYDIAFDAERELVRGGRIDLHYLTLDDDESVCRAIKRLLKVAGIAIDMFPRGESFVTMLSATPSYRPACVILDFEVPGTKGLELLRHLAPTGVPFILITAHDDPAVGETASCRLSARAI